MQLSGNPQSTTTETTPKAPTAAAGRVAAMAAAAAPELQQRRQISGGGGTAATGSTFLRDFLCPRASTTADLKMMATRWLQRHSSFSGDGVFFPWSLAWRFGGLNGDDGGWA
ncbi:hypothetical protein AHAS_Ahas13G0280400 [Arachis hypogaea]